jgi:hypothetical protein
MKYLKHIKRFNEATENLNKSDVRSSLKKDDIVLYNDDRYIIINRIDDDIILKPLRNPYGGSYQSSPMSYPTFKTNINDTKLNFNSKSISDVVNNESSISRYYDNDLKRKIKIGDIKIGDKIKFIKSTSVFRRFIPSFKGKVAGYGEEYFFKGEIYEFVNYWSDFARDGGFDYDETMAMEFECLESPKKDRVGYKLVLSLRHFHEYKDENIFEII